MNESKKEERHKHPSFGQIRFSRVSGRAKFYGSELEQDHYIIMELVQSEVNRTLSQDWYFGHGVPLAAIRMTANQFSELITSLNCGSGIPCTIEILNKQKVDDLPYQESRKEFVHRKFDDRMREFADTLKVKQNRVKELTAKKTLSKEDQKELNFTVEWLTTEVASNIPFFAKCFQETMDEVVLEAKTEVENAIQHKITTLGLQALHEQNKLLK
jgi:hypothetical protein